MIDRLVIKIRLSLMTISLNDFRLLVKMRRGSILTFVEILNFGSVYKMYFPISFDAVVRES